MTTTLRRLLGIAALSILTLPAMGQETAADSSAWKRDLTGKLSVTQAGFQNWADGGTNSLALSSGLDGRFEKTKGAWTALYEVRAGYGLIKQDTLETRKAEDLWVLKATFEYAGERFFSKFKPTAFFSARSQFWEGFDYKEKKSKPDRGHPKVSDAFSPATLVQQLGLSYESTSWMTHNFGVAGKETIVLIERLRPRYSMDLDETVRVEVGLGLVTDIDADLAENIHYRSSAAFFASFNKPDAPDMLWENVLTMKVNSWLTTNLEWVFLLDQDVTDALQMREVFSISIAYHFL